MTVRVLDSENLGIEKRYSSIEEVSDGYHTFKELYDHRHALFINVILSLGNIAFKTRKNREGEAWDGWFILAADTEVGQISYHLPDTYWDLLSSVREVERNSTYDNHSSDDVQKRLLLLAAAKDRSNI